MCVTRLGGTDSALRADFAARGAVVAVSVLNLDWWFEIGMDPWVNCFLGGRIWRRL